MERKRRLRSGRSSVPAAAKTWKKKKVVTPNKDEDEKPKVDVKVANQAIPEVKESVTVKHEPINVEFKPQLRSKSSTFGSDQSTGVASETVNARPLISPQGKTFSESGIVVPALNAIIRTHWHNNKCVNWTTTPQNVRDLWWQEFQCQFRWEPTHTIEMYRVFKKKVGDCLRNTTSKAKKDQKKPIFISKETWQEIQADWADPKVQERAEQNRQHRASEACQGAIYTGGSIDVQQHRLKLYKTLDRAPTWPEVFNRCYQKKDGTWSGSRAQQIHDTYTQLLATKTRETGSPTVVDEMSLWVEAAGGVKHGRVFGMSPLVHEPATTLQTQVTELEKKLQSKDDELQDVRKTLHGLAGVVSQLQDHVLHNPNQAGHSGQ